MEEEIDNIYTDEPKKHDYDFETYIKLIKETLIKYQGRSEKYADWLIYENYTLDYIKTEIFEENYSPMCAGYGMIIHFL